MNKTRLERIKDYSPAAFAGRAGTVIAALLLPGYEVGRFLKTRFFATQFRYETVVAPFLAQRLFWFFWPAYRLLKAFRICFVVNIAEGGHTIVELDYFFRRLSLGEIDSNQRYVWIKKYSYSSTTCVDLYRHIFWWAGVSNLLYLLLLPITMRYQDITIDCGLSRLKWLLPDDATKYHRRVDQGQTYLYQLTKHDQFQKLRRYYQLRSNSSSYYPIKSDKSPVRADDLASLLGDAPQRFALVHLKYDVKNATAEPTDPATYLDALGYLIGLGYQLVFVGREKMPLEFQEFDIINYSESLIASFRNDLALFDMAELAIVSGSGILYLADCQAIPMLYINSWHLQRLPFSRHCVCVPTLALTKSGNFLTVSRQLQLHNELPDIGGEKFPKHLIARNASSDEILAGLKELLDLQRCYEKRSRLQEEFMKLDGDDSRLALSESRISEHFLNKHAALLDESLAKI